jgi:predicted aspartyl protease
MVRTPTVAAPLLSLLLVLALVACQPGAPRRIEAPADPVAGEVPFRLAGPGDAAMLVDVHIGDAGPFPFVVDTGASLTCLDENLADRLELAAAPAIGAAFGIGGGGRVRMVRIDQLRLGETTAHELIACALDLEPLRRLPGFEAQGLLGLSFLKAFRVTIDFEREVLRLDPV